MPDRGMSSAVEGDVRTRFVWKRKIAGLTLAICPIRRVSFVARHIAVFADF